MKVYLVAGEPSGDLLASGMMKALVKVDPNVQFRGVGGESMTALGFQSRFNIAEISVMGFFEVFPRLPLILKRINQTVKDIELWNPDVLVTVDSWGFVTALLSKLRKRGTKIPVVHYVAPQVWAWKKGRAKKAAYLIDRLMMLLPDEGQYFEKYGLHCDFVGHPVVERMSAAVYDADDFRRRHSIPADADVFCILPGSRQGEINKLGPIFKESIKQICRKYPNAVLVIPTVAAMETKVRKTFAGMKIPLRVVCGSNERYNAFNISKFALAASGTVSLELTALGVPHLIAYRFNSLTNFAVKRVIKIRFANLINLLANKEIIPEFVLDNCRPDLIANCALHLLEFPEMAEKQVVEAKEMLQRLRLPDIIPSDRAAQIVLEVGRGKD